jgi:hypothetical protein
MTRASCARERDVLRAVAREWREECDAVVATHVASCGRCSEVRAAAELLRAQHERDTQAARVASGAAMWWRLERRVDAERARRAHRTAVLIQAVVLASAAGVAAAVLQIVAPWLHGPASAAADTWSAAIAGAVTAWSRAATKWTVPIALLMSAWMLLVPAALYLAFTADRDER